MIESKLNFSDTIEFEILTKFTKEDLEDATLFISSVPRFVLVDGNYINLSNFLVNVKDDIIIDNIEFLKAVNKNQKYIIVENHNGEEIKINNLDLDIIFFNYNNSITNNKEFII